jgi:(E)-4-hydroxy-3-methylbut-2-enyl-diphosphate synthase
LRRRNLVRVVVTRATFDKVAPRFRRRPTFETGRVYEDLNVQELDPRSPVPPDSIPCDTQLVTVRDGVDLPAVTAFRLLAARLRELGRRNPILLKDCLASTPCPFHPTPPCLQASVVIGSLLADGVGDAVLVRGESGAGQSLRLAFNILQAAGCRSFKTDYVACPSCGRTLFNLQTVTARIKARTDHLKGVKDRHHGLHRERSRRNGGRRFRLRRRRPGQNQPLRRQNRREVQHPEVEAVDRLVDLIRDHGKWVEPETPAALPSNAT